MPEMTERLEELQASGETIGLLAANAELFNAAAAAFRARRRRALPGCARARRPARSLSLDLSLVLQQALRVHLSQAGGTQRRRAGARHRRVAGVRRVHRQAGAKIRRRCSRLLDIVAAEDDKAYQEYVTRAADPALRPPVVPLAVRCSLSRGVQADVPADARADQGRIHPGRPLRRRGLRQRAEQSGCLHAARQPRGGRRRPPFRG